MFPAIPPALAGFSPVLAVFLFLVLFGYTTPIPEELALVIAGASLKAAGLSLPLALPLAILALSLADLGFYSIARFLGPKLLRLRILSRILRPERIAMVEGFFRARGPRILFACRFIPGLRMAAILSSGFLRLPLLRFVTYDSGSIVLAALAWMGVGYAVGLGFLDNASTLARILALAAVAVLVAGAVLAARRLKARLMKAPMVLLDKLA